MGDICEIQALEVKYIYPTISLKRLSGVKLAKDDYKKKKTHELVLKMPTKATINMTTIILMKIESLNDQCALALFTMPLVVVKID
jgi:hypothetical protein